MVAATQTSIPAIRILRLKDVRFRVGLSRSSLYTKLKIDPEFPRPIPLGAKAVGWIESEIEAWLSAQAAKRGRQ